MYVLYVDTGENKLYLLRIFGENLQNQTKIFRLE